MKTNKRIIGLFVWFSGMLPMNAQSDDFGVWTSVELKKKIFPGMSLSAEGNFRTRDGLSQTDRWTGSLGMDYRICSWLKASTAYNRFKF